MKNRKTRTKWVSINAHTDVILKKIFAAHETKSRNHFDNLNCVNTILMAWKEANIDKHSKQEVKDRVKGKQQHGEVSRLTTHSSHTQRRREAPLATTTAPGEVSTGSRRVI